MSSSALQSSATQDTSLSVPSSSIRSTSLLLLCTQFVCGLHWSFIFSYPAAFASASTPIMGLPPGPRKNRYAPLQQSAAWILSYPLIQDTVLTLDLLEGPLNSLADVYDDVEYANVDAGMLARAFTDTDENAKLMEEERFLYSYDETFPDVKFDDSEKHMLYTHIRKEGEKEIGQFTKPQSGVLRLNSRMIKDAPRGEDKQILRDARIFRSEDRAFYNWIDDNVPVETKADIQNFLKAYKKEQVRMATVNANKKGAKEKGNAKNLKRKNDQRESRKMPSPMKAMASFRSGLASISRPTTPKRPGSRGSAKKKQKKVGVKEAVLDLHTEYLETKNLIRAGVGKLRDLKQKIDNEMDGLDADIVAEVEALIKSAEDMNLSEPATVDPSADPSAAPSADPSADPSAAPSNSTKPTVDTPLYLIYKGKVLKGSAMEEVLLFDEIEEMLDEVDPAVDNPRQEAIRNTRDTRRSDTAQVIAGYQREQPSFHRPTLLSSRKQWLSKRIWMIYWMESNALFLEMR